MTPCGCEDGDYRDECWRCDNPSVPHPQYPGGEGLCSDGTHWETGTGGREGSCVPDDPGDGGGGPSQPTPSDCPAGEGRLYPGGPCVGGSQSTSGRYTGGGDEGGGFGNFPQFRGSSVPRFDIQNAPRFTAPNFTAPGPFQAPQFQTPDYAAIQNDPSFQFRLNQGRRALESSAAARGTLNTGGTLRGIVDYGQALASNEAGNVFNRALQTFDRLYSGRLQEYESNYRGRVDEFDREYAGQRDEFAPQLAEWQMRSTAAMRAGELQFQREWERYLAELERWKWLTPSAGDILRAGASD